jgi:VanZ family protein
MTAVRRWAWLAWTFVVLVASALPASWLLGVAPRESWSALSSVAHILEFLLLAALLLWSLSREQDDGVRRYGTGATVWRAILGAFMVALAVELMQWPLPYRSFDPLDLLADAGGIAAAVAAFSVLERRSVSPGR